MPIDFKTGVDILDLRQAPYSASLRDRAAMNDILDPLKEQGYVEDVPFSQPSLVSAPAFLVWKNDKPRLVIDLRRVNTKLNLNTYPLPRQDTILSALGGAIVFSSLDITKSFFQQKIAPEDR